MKNLFIFKFFIIISMLVFVSCQKDEFESGLVRDDNPPPGIYQNESDYGSFYQVYVEKIDLDAAKYFGNFQNGYSNYYDEQTGVRVERVYSQDYFKIPAKKYFGPFQEQIYISNSTEFYIISAGDLAYIKEIIARKGSAIVDFGGRDIDWRWKTISGAR